MGEKMEVEKLICGDCNSTSDFRKGKRGSALVEKLLWVTLFFPGIFYSIWRGWSQKKSVPIAAVASYFLLILCFCVSNTRVDKLPQAIFL